MIQVVGPMHTLHPKYWKEWAKEQNMEFDLWFEIMCNQPSDTVYDLIPDDFRQTYDAIWRAAAHHALEAKPDVKSIFTSISADNILDALQNNYLDITPQSGSGV